MLNACLSFFVLQGQRAVGKVWVMSGDSEAGWLPRSEGLDLFWVDSECPRFDLGSRRGPSRDFRPWGLVGTLWLFSQNEVTLMPTGLG